MFIIGEPFAIFPNLNFRSVGFRFGRLRLDCANCQIAQVIEQALGKLDYIASQPVQPVQPVQTAPVEEAAQPVEAAAEPEVAPVALAPVTAHRLFQVARKLITIVHAFN